MQRLQAVSGGVAFWDVFVERYGSVSVRKGEGREVSFRGEQAGYSELGRELWSPGWLQRGV